MQRFFSVVNTLVLLDALLVDSQMQKHIFSCLGGQVPNPHVIQSLTVFIEKDFTPHWLDLAPVEIILP